MNWRNHSLGRLFLHRAFISRGRPPIIKFFYRHTVFTWLANERANNVVFTSCKVLDIVQF